MYYFHFLCIYINANNVRCCNHFVTIDFTFRLEKTLTHSQFVDRSDDDSDEDQIIETEEELRKFLKLQHSCVLNLNINRCLALDGVGVECDAISAKFFFFF